MKFVSRGSKGRSGIMPHEVDAVVLMATTLSSKRRPAQLVEIVAAADLIQGFVPFAEKLGAAIERLSGLGLIEAAEDGFTLTPSGRQIMARQPKKASQEELLAAVGSDLSAYRPVHDGAAVVLDEKQLETAVRAHKVNRKEPGKNLLMPKTKVTRHFKVEGRWRRAVKNA